MAPQFWSKMILQGMSRGIRKTSGLNEEKEVAVAHASLSGDTALTGLHAGNPSEQETFRRLMDLGATKKGR